MSSHCVSDTYRFYVKINTAKGHPTDKRKEKTVKVKPKKGYQ